jgi:hypothetical protein
MIRIPFQTEDFPVGSVPNGFDQLPVDWGDVLWSAVTVGRPNRHDVFRHGAASLHEAIFRMSMVRMALEQSGPGGYRLTRTQAAKTLDPTEKGAVNYFLGMIFCKLFAAKLLNTPWVMHLDVYRPGLNAVLSGRSRPDLIGQHELSGDWHAFECKGRLSKPDSKVKSKAKAQAQRVVTVNGNPCALQIGAVTYFNGDTLQFYWRDPEPEKGLPNIEIKHTDSFWRLYYQPSTDLVRSAVRGDIGLLRERRGMIEIEALDLSIGLHPEIAKLVFTEQWSEAKEAAGELREELIEQEYQPDGIRLLTGGSWLERFEESQ